MENGIILYNIGKLVTCRELDGDSMDNIEILENAYMVIENRVIVDIGVGEIPSKYIKISTKLMDAEGKLVVPGLIDSHTHLIHGGSRENEFLDKIQGVSYLDILKKGGGILSTVKATRKATDEELLNKAKDTLHKMLAFGVTTVESKSGYGLDEETEKRQLKLNKILNNEQDIRIISTYMGAHAIPNEYKDNPRKYIELVKKVAKEVKNENLAEFFDVFCEKGVFSYEESKELLLEAKKLGYKLRIHADEIENMKGAELGAELGVYSADHLMAISDEGIKALKEKKIIANLLPATSFSLGKDYAPARKIIDSGVQVALSTDYNPGSCPSENLQFVMQLAALKLKMTPKEIIKAVTINAAKVLGIEKEVGSLEKWKRADFVIFNAKSLEYILYHFGINHTDKVFKNGKLVYMR